MKKLRKVISFKLENLPEKQRIIVDQWANNQTNIQQSLANVLMHVVKFTGDADIMDFDIQEKLYNTLSNTNTVQIVQKQADRPAKQINEDNRELTDVYEKMDWLHGDD